MLVKIFITTFLFITTFCYTQISFNGTIKDTIYISFDSILPTMKKAFGSSRNIARFDYNQTKVHTGTYFIDEKVRPNPQMYDTGYKFAYLELIPFEQASTGFRSSMALVRDSTFLNTIKPLDHTFFETTDYLKVCKTFEAEESHEQDVIIFIIDKDEIKNGKIVLREVKFSRPTKE